MPHIYSLTPEGAALAARAAEIASTVAAKHAADVDTKGRFPAESIAALADAGLFGLCVPKELGGLGQGPRTFVAVVEELARACGSTAMVYVMHVTASNMIGASATLPDREAILRAVAAGKHLTTLAFSEKGSRSQFWAPVSKLTVDGDGFTTNAYKSWVTTAHNADSYVSSAQAAGASSPMESVLYLVRKGHAGARIAAPWDGLGLRGNDSAPVSLEGYRVTNSDLLTKAGEGAKGMLEVVLPWFAAGTSAMAMGLCRGATDATISHLTGTGFEHDGSKLRDLAVLRAEVAKMFIRTEQGRALLGYMAGEMESPSATTPLYVLSARQSSLECAVDVTDIGMKACGGAAFSKHLPLERIFRDARAGWVMAPTVNHLQEFIGRALTGLPLFG